MLRSWTAAGNFDTQGKALVILVTQNSESQFNWLSEVLLVVTVASQAHVWYDCGTTFCHHTGLPSNVVWYRQTAGYTEVIGHLTTWDHPI